MTHATGLSPFTKACRICTVLLGSITVASLAGCHGPSTAPPALGPATHPATAAATQPALSRFEFVQPKMGTVFRIVLYAPNANLADRAADDAFARVDALNGMLSDYDPKSEISQLSAMTDDGPMPAPVPVSDDLWRVLERSMEAARLSDGAFDVTIGPFVRLWRRSRDMHELPTPERLAIARQSVGWRHVRLDPEHHTVQLLARKMRLDVGGIAKGYTAEQVMQVLRKQGIDRALVGAAGDIAAGEPPPGHATWRVGIQSLEKPDEVAAYVRLRNRGVSTSGDTYRVIELNGTRYSHIIDPKTGLGMTSRIGVTVIAPDTFTSDWLATAVSVMGEEKGMALIEQMPGCAARIVTIDAEGHRHVQESHTFADFADADK